MREEAGCAGRPGGAERREVGLRKACRGDLVFSRPSEAARVVWSFALDR